MRSHRASAKRDAKGWLCKALAPAVTGPCCLVVPWLGTLRWKGFMTPRWPNPDLGTPGLQCSSGAAGTLQLSSTHPGSCSVPSLATVPAPSPGCIGRFHGISCLPDLSRPPMPRAFPPPPLVSALNYNEPSHPLSPQQLLPHRAKLLDQGHRNMSLLLTLSTRSGPVHPILEPRDSPGFFNVSSPLFLSSSNHRLFDRSPVVPRCWEPPSAVTAQRWGGGACAFLGVA